MSQEDKDNKDNTDNIFIQISELDAPTNNIIVQGTTTLEELFGIETEETTRVFALGLGQQVQRIGHRRRKLQRTVEQPRRRKRTLSHNPVNNKRRRRSGQRQEQRQEQQEQRQEQEQEQQEAQAEGARLAVAAGLATAAEAAGLAVTAGLATTGNPLQDQFKEINEIISLFETENPFYVTSKAVALVRLKKPPSFDKKTNDGKIRIIKPMSMTATIENLFAYRSLAHHEGTLFDWQVILGQMDFTGELFNLPKSSLKQTKPIYNTNIYSEAESIFEKNQWLRWQFKRLLNKWLTKKSHKRIIGADCDLITGDPVPPQEQIKVISITTRTVYIFSGHVLLKNTKTCLENQVGAIPTVKAPNNPFTNTPFTYGEIIQVHNEILAWCGKKGKAFPAVLALYRDYKFKNYLLSRVNNNYLQLKAAETYILNDDVTGEFFSEAIEGLLEEYEDLLNVEFDSIIVSLQRFLFWNRHDPKHYLLITWKKFAAHFWYYKQTEQAPRENWRSYNSIYVDLVILIRASMMKLENLYKEYSRRAIIIATITD